MAKRNGRAEFSFTSFAHSYDGVGLLLNDARLVYLHNTRGSIFDLSPTAFTRPGVEN
jgi:hypothetical protein